MAPLRLKGRLSYRSKDWDVKELESSEMAEKYLAVSSSTVNCCGLETLVGVEGDDQVIHLVLSPHPAPLLPREAICSGIPA
jgi:hypothetical protein